MDGLMNWDPYLLFADFQAYSECQTRVSPSVRGHRALTAMSILNVARSGHFSSDRTIREYWITSGARRAYRSACSRRRNSTAVRDRVPSGSARSPSRGTSRCELRIPWREDLRLEDVPEPTASAGEVKLRVLYNGICGSDLHEFYHGPITTRTTPHR